MIEARHVTSAASPVVLVELQRSSTTDLAQLLRTAVAAGDVRLVVDLGERKDASSDVLTLLHRAARHLRRLGGSLAVVAHDRICKRLFDVTLLSQAFPVFASRDEALRDWRRGTGAAARTLARV